MFNVAVWKMKDIIKYIMCIFVLILIVFVTTKYVTNTKDNVKKIEENVQNTASSFFNKNLLACLDTSIPVMAQVNEEYKKVASEDDVKDNGNKNILHSIIGTQISTINGLEKEENKKISEEEKNKGIKQANKENNEENTKKEESNPDNPKEKTQGNVEIAQEGLKTEVITNNPIKESFNIEYGKVKIKNQTDYQLTQEMLTPDISIQNKNIMIFHTHSCESYTPSENYQYTPTGNFRTTDLNFTVTRVGTELTNHLQQYGYNIIHDTSYNDYPSYNGSYTKSLKTVENLLKTNPSDIIIDLHRDAIGSRSDYAPTVKIGEKDVAAQIMFVIGTNNGGLWHPNWNQNLKFAIKIQEKAEEMYPGLFKPIMLTNSRYNQHAGKYANIIEVGATGNTMEQCLTSMKYLAKIMNEVIK